MSDEKPSWKERVVGIALALVIYGGVMCLIVWMMISYPIDH